jgi:hypothetical protein
VYRRIQKVRPEAKATHVINTKTPITCQHTSYKANLTLTLTLTR